MSEHLIHRGLLGRAERNPVHVHLVGVGGSGSQVLTGLARLHLALMALGFPSGLHVTAYDPDSVSDANVGRQLFSPGDVGAAKATVLVTRLNAFFGLDWEAVTTRWEQRQATGDLHQHSLSQPDVLISCVDTAAARRTIHAAIAGPAAVRPLYWLDLGNDQESGQVVLGQSRAETEQARDEGGRYDWLTLNERQPRLPHVLDLYPELRDETLPEDDRPSCSLAEALETQDLFVNQHVATWALELLWRLFREGRIRHHGVFINLREGRVMPLPVPAAAEVRMAA